MKMYVGVAVYHHMFLTLALGGGEWLDPCPGCFTPKVSPWYPLNRRLVVITAGLDVVAKRKKLPHCHSCQSYPNQHVA